MSALVLVDFKHIKTRKTKGGLAYYFRRRGFAMVRLPNDPTSPEFSTAYQKALAGVADRPRLSGHGTFAWLCDQYMESSAFITKAPATRTARARIIGSMVAERLDPAHPETFGQERVDAFGPEHIAVLRDRKATVPNAANERVKILAQIFGTSAARSILKVSPTVGAERLQTPRGGHETASDADLAQYLSYHTSGPPWLAMMLLKGHGMRVSDLRLLGRRNRNGTTLSFVTVKTGRLCEHPIEQETLQAIHQFDGDAWLLTEAGQPYASDKALSQRIAKWFRQAGVTGITAHGVRKWLATRFADRGATEYEMMAWFGWGDPKEARPYVQAANRRALSQSAGRILAFHRGR
jgi:hypothetical protein